MRGCWQHLLGITHAQYLADPDRKLNGAEVAAFATLVLRRERGDRWPICSAAEGFLAAASG